MKPTSRYTKALQNKIRVLRLALAEKQHPRVIKYVSVDGLSRVEVWKSAFRPEETLYRTGVIVPRISELTETSVPTGLAVHRRIYRLSDSYVDPENGNRVFEYRERL